MKPRRLVKATTFSISWSRATVKTWTSPPGRRKRRPTSPRGGEVNNSQPSSLLEDGEDVAGRVLEPGDVRAAIVGKASSHPFLVGDAAVVLELDAFGGQLVYGL